MRISSFLATAVAVLVLTSSGATPSYAGNVFSKLAGTWSGGGSARFTNGKRERLTCRAYYTKKGVIWAWARDPLRQPVEQDPHARLFTRQFGGHGNLGRAHLQCRWQRFGYGNWLDLAAFDPRFRFSGFGFHLGQRAKSQSVYISTGASELKGVSLSFRKR